MISQSQTFPLQLLLLSTTGSSGSKNEGFLPLQFAIEYTLPPELLVIVLGRGNG
jgi:hypothetical protein